MNTETLLIIFIAITALAVVIQMGVLIALYAAVKRTGQRLDEVSSEVKTRLVPFIQQAEITLKTTAPKLDSVLTEAQAILENNGPKVGAVLDNLVESSSLAKAQLQRADATVGEILDRTRLHVMRADEMVSRTLNRVQHATETMQNTVSSPLRRASMLLHAFSVGFGTLFGRRGPNGRPIPREDMFV